MDKVTKHYSIAMSQVELSSKESSVSKIYPVMDIAIFGTPSLLDIINLMNDIKSSIKEIEGDYISITDLSKLIINKFFSKIILSGMESTYKSLVSVGRQSIISFVVLGETQEYKDTLSNTLHNINEQKIDTEKDYKYRYYFVKSKEEIKAIAQQILM